MEIVLVAVVGLLCVICFIVGAVVGQAAAKGEDIKPPVTSPIKAFKEHEAKKEAEMEQHRIDVIMRNIEAYDGTGRGQEDVPGR